MKRVLFGAGALVVLVASCYNLNNPLDPKAANYQGPPSTVRVPDAPSVTATAGGSQVTLTWATVSGATGYTLYWSSTSTIVRDEAHTVSSVTSPHVQSSLNNGTTYWFELTASNSAGESDASLAVSAVPVDPAHPILRIDGVTGTLNFGTVPPVGVSLPLNITNIGNAPMTIQQLSSTSGAWKFSVAGSGTFDTTLQNLGPFEPGVPVHLLAQDAWNIDVDQDHFVFDLGGQTVSLPVSVSISATGIGPSIVVSVEPLPIGIELTSTNPANYDWGSLTAGSTATPLGFTATNPGDFTFRSFSVLVTGGFSLVAANGVPGFVAGGGSFTFQVAPPTVASGSPYQGTLTIQTGDHTYLTVNLTATVN